MKKFLFENNNFDDDAPDQAAQEQAVQVEQARAEAYDRGRAEALDEARAILEAKTLDVVQAVAAHLEQLAKSEDRREVEAMRRAARLSMKVIHKILPALTAKHGLEEIERVILENMETRRDEPRIAVTLPTQYLDVLREKIDAVAIEKGFAGKIILIADDNLGPADCRVEWADGGAEKLYERLFLQIQNEFTKTIDSMGLPADAPAPQENTAQGETGHE